MDISNPLEIKESYRLPEDFCFDVIVSDSTLLVTGYAGVSQYKLNGTEKITLISHISTVDP